MTIRNIDFNGAATGDVTNAPGATGWTAYGGYGNDTFTGGVGEDWLSGGNGADILRGGAGDDILGGESGEVYSSTVTSYSTGDDSIFGGDGKDRIAGGAGRDLLDGGTGDDVIHGDAYAFLLSGQTSTTPLTYTTAEFLDFELRPQFSSYDYDDRIMGGAGDDVIYGEYGADWIDGDGRWFNSTDPTQQGTYVGNDTLFGGSGDDIIAGGLGNDTIDGGADNDILFGDDSVLQHDRGAGPDGVYNNLLQSAGEVGGNDILNGGDGNDIIEGGAGDDLLTGGHGNDRIHGGSGVDTIYGDDSGAGLVTGDDLLFGNGGDDIIRAGGGADIVDGGEGNDRITGDDATNSGADTLMGWNGDDVITGGGGNDRIDGDGFFKNNGSSQYASGKDTLSGDAGNDVIAGGGGDDIIDGGSDNDLLLGDGLVLEHDMTSGADNIYKPVIGYGLYADSADLSGPREGGADILNGGTGDDTIFAGGGADKANGGSGADKIDGGHGNDELFGDDGDDRVMGGGGNDILRGGAGADRMDGDGSYTTGLSSAEYTGNDTLYGEAGNDVLTGGAGDDIVDGGDDNDVLYGDGSLLDLQRSIPGGALDTISDTGSFAAGAREGGKDQLKGGAGDDTIFAGGGADILDGGTGKDTMYGGYGDDLYLVDQSDDVVVEFDFGGNDRVLTTVTYALDADTEVEVLEAAADAGSLSLTGNRFAQRIQGSDGNNRLYGRGGNDIIVGGRGNDELYGDEGDDRLDGGDDNDWLTGGTGSDTLDGGAGVDTAIYYSDVVHTVTTVAGVTRVASSEGADTLTNIERLRFLNIELDVGAMSGATVIGSNGADSVDGTALNDMMYGFNGADILNGGDGDDRLAGGRGNDTLNGGAGADTADYSLAAGAVTASLLMGTASNDGDGGSDVLVGIENLYGSAFDDVLTGDAGNNVLRGGKGNDTLTGGGGTDMADYSAAASGVTARLDIMKALNDGDGGTDTFTSIEGIIGSAFNDLLIGGALGDTLKGGLGADTLLGFAGNDVLWGGAGAANTLQGGLGDDLYVLEANDSITELAGEGLDTVDVRIAIYNLAANVENMFFGGTGSFTGAGNALNNVITGGAGDDILTGRGGNDTLQGGAGMDIADYAQAAAGIHARLDNMRAMSDGDGGTDTFVSIEGIEGSAFNDLLVGGALGDRLSGGFGADTILGGGGNDVLLGGQGLANELHGGEGDDYYILDALDTIVELAGQGHDTVEAHVGAHIMGANVEDMFYVGYNKFYGTGNALNNVIKGGIGDDILKGMGGNDSLYGGEGRDEVQFRGSKAQYTVTPEGSGYRVVDNIAGRDGSTYVDSIEVLRFMADGGVTALNYSRSLLASPEADSKDDGGAQVSPLADDDAFVLSAPADEPQVQPDMSFGKFDAEPLVLPGEDASHGLFLDTQVAPHDWTVPYEGQGLFGADHGRHGDLWQ